MRRRLLAATLCIAALSACGDDSVSTGEPSATAVTPAPTTPTSTTLASEAPATTQVVETASTGAPTPADTAAEAAPEVLQFAAPLLGGGSLDFTQYAGRTVALWFWAPT